MSILIKNSSEVKSQDGKQKGGCKHSAHEVGLQQKQPDTGATVRIISLKNVFTVFINLAVLGLHCFRGYSLVSVHWLLFAVISLLAAPGLSHAGSVDKVHRYSYPTACGIFLDQGSNLCPLHWQVDSLPLSHQGSPKSDFTFAKL